MTSDWISTNHGLLQLENGSVTFYRFRSLIARKRRSGHKKPKEGQMLLLPMKPMKTDRIFDALLI